MSVNKLLFAPEWRIIGTVSTPDSGYKVLYPKQGYTQWFVMDDMGTEKQISLGFYPKNGISVTTYATSSVFERELNIALGLGLTFSGDFQGSTISVSNVTTDMLKSLGSATAGYVLTATGSNFDWVPFTAPGISGTTDRIPKFISTSSIGDSIMREDSSRILIGATPSVVSASFNNVGNLYNTGKIYLKDSNNLYVESNSGILVVTDQNFRIQDELGYRYLSLSTDNTGLSGAYTFSVLSDTVIMGHTATERYLDSSLNRITIGTGSTGLGVNLYSNTPGGTLRIQDGSEGAKKALVSDATGLGAWTQLDESYVTFTGTQNFLARYNGTAINGLTASAIYQGLTSSVILIGYTNSHSSYDSDTNALRVKGDVYFENDYISDPKFLLNTTYLFNDSSYNIALGKNALAGNGFGKGARHIAIGQSALQSVSSLSLANIGIGLNTLYYTLDGSKNVAIGEYGLFANTGSHNVGIGGEIFYQKSSGNNNVGIGHQGAISMSSGANNVIIGASALYSATNGSNNIAVGQNVGGSLLGSTSSVLIGRNIQFSGSQSNTNTVIGTNQTIPAGFDNSVAIGTGDGQTKIYVDDTNNVFLGNYDLTKIVQTADNVGIGEGLANIQSGGLNIAIGRQALDSLIIGSHNIAIGRGVLSLATASYNIGIGTNNLVNLENGENNISIGYGGLASVISGNNNIGLGRDTGTGLEGSNNILIGHYVIHSGTYSNNTIIGSNLTVPNGASNSIILANGAGQIKFGSLTYSLDVFGTASIQGGVGIKTTPDTNYDLKVAGDTYVGGKFALSKSTNKAVGTFSLSSGVATVLNTSITTNSLIFLTHQTQNSVNGILSITSKTASVGFSVNSSNGSDNNFVAYMIVEAI